MCLGEKLVSVADGYFPSCEIYSDAQAQQSGDNDDAKGDDSDTIEGEYKEV